MKFETHVKEIIQRTHNVKSFRFPRPEELSYKPGQFLFVTLKSEGKELKKHFSFSSSPTERDHIEFTKKLSESDFSHALKDLKEGDWASIDAPYGQFTFEGEHPKIGLLAGGIGITPFIGMCKYCTDLHLNTKITLLYGNRAENDIAFKDEIEEFQRLNQNLKATFIISEATKEWNGPTGIINTDLVKKEIPDYGESVLHLRSCGNGSNHGKAHRRFGPA